MTRPAEGEPAGEGAASDERRVADDTERDRERRHQDADGQPDDPRDDRDGPQPFSGSDH
jgi:hypothetical protein